MSQKPDRIARKQLEKKKQNNYASPHQFRSRSNSFPTTVGDLKARLQVPTGIHETPFIFPVLVAGVVDDFPRFVEGFEPVAES
jgi:hypothetical protein